MALALCATLAVPALWRPAVATAGGLFAIGVGYATLSLGWHFPSDTIGGFLVAALWTALAVAAVSRWDELSPPRDEPARDSPLAHAAPALLLGAALLGALLVTADRPHAVASYAEEHPAFMLGAATIAALAALLTAAASAVTTARR
jgi:hypothetical protein